MTVLGIALAVLTAQLLIIAWALHLRHTRHGQALRTLRQLIGIVDDGLMSRDATDARRALQRVDQALAWWRPRLVIPMESRKRVG